MAAKKQTTDKQKASNAVTKVAALIRQAYVAGVPCAPVRDLLPLGDLAAAYAVQELNTRIWLRAGRRLGGRKIGLTAKAVQRQLGVDQPDYGMLFADMILGDGETVSKGRVLQPRVEAEVALVLGQSLESPSATVADVLRCTAYAVPALEIVGSRIADWDIRISDTIADNASSGLCVLGGPARRLAGLDLRDCTMKLSKNGELVSSGNGAACLGHPLNAAAWLARKMAEVGRPLGEGDVIMTGALGPMIPAAPGDGFEAVISGLGTVRTSFDA